MKIGLHDSDKTSFPNLALMKISSWHKICGDDVEWFDNKKQYDIVYSSKVFTFTREDDSLPKNTIKGGTGYDLSSKLPLHIEVCCPDYSIYNLDYSLGFLTRNCPNKCSWCFVPLKNEQDYPLFDIEDFLLHKRVVLMDNNPLAYDHGIRQIEKMIDLGVKVDFNQGLDPRRIDNGIAKLLSKLKWDSPLRLACDTPSSIEHVRKAVELLRWHNTTPRQYFCYTLVTDVDEAIERVKFLKGIYVDPFAQPYLDIKGTPPSRYQKQFARWVNTKQLFKNQSWEDYKTQHHVEEEVYNHGSVS